MRIKLFGRYWDLFRDNDSLTRTQNGLCDPPEKQGKKITVRKSLRGQAELEILVHEMLHACDFHKDETWIDTTAHDITQVLWRLGYRKVTPPAAASRPDP